MKHISIYLLLCAVFTAKSQSSIHLVTTNPAGTSTIAVINNGGGYSVTTTANTNDIPSKFRFYNIDANNTYTYNVLRTIKILNAQGSATASTYFCVGATCLPPAANTLTNPGDYIVINPDTFDIFITYFNEISTIGYSEVYYKIFNVNNPNDTLSFTMYYNPALSVKNIDVFFENLTVSPMPAKERILIQANVNSSMNINVNLANVLGQTFLNFSEKINEGFYKKHIDVSNLPEGVYFLTIQANGLRSSKISKKIIITR
ncbi:MAG: hypothetical protein KatS3mg027_0564 [Bacteroidia bacterium]|nr:MAG: hypothetical protein KatS3mg027_0564 [Bacteroidia bacterium]